MNTKKIFILIFVLIVGIVDIYLFQKLIFKEVKEEVKKEKKQEAIQSDMVTEKETSTQTEAIQKEAVEETHKETSPVQVQPEIVPEEEKQEEQVHLAETTPEKKLPEEKEKEKDISPPAVEEGYMIARVYVNLRSEPDVNSEIVTVIKKGDSVKVIGKKARHWKRVLYRQKERIYEGWVDDRFFIKGESLESQ